MEREFKPNSAYNSIYHTQIGILKNELRNELLEDLRNNLSRGVLEDTCIRIQGEDYICKNKCIVNALFPSLILVESSTQAKCVNVFTDEPTSKQKLSMIYDTKKDSCTIELMLEIIEDLQKLLHDNKYADVIFQLQDDTTFHCHKCILLSRCNYFSLMLMGNWAEKDKPLIPLKGISSRVFQTVVNYIYTGKSEIATDVDLRELIIVEDMYNLKGLKQAIKFHIRSNFLHFYHVPCSFCIKGLVKICNILTNIALPGYEGLLSRIYSWFCRYYHKILGDRAFSRAPEQLKQSLLTKVQDSVNPQNVIAHLNYCGKLKSCLPNVQWGKEMYGNVQTLEKDFMKYVTDNFVDVTKYPGFIFCLFQDKDLYKTKMLQDIFILSVKNHISIENCLNIFMRWKEMENQLGKENETVQLEDLDKFSEELISLCKNFIKRNLMRLQRMDKWTKLDTNVKRELTDYSGFIGLN